MPKDFKILFASTIGLIILLLGFSYSILRTPEVEPQTIIIEDEVNTQEELGAFVEGSKTQLIIQTFGDEKNVKTFIESDGEYALSRNPGISGDLELVITDPFGNYYFTENNLGEKIVFENGNGNAKYGYQETALISGELLRNLNTDTDLFIAYPDALSAEIAGIPVVPDSGASNRFLQNQLAVITNINNNVTVIAEIVHRVEEQGVLHISERVRKSLGLQDGALGNISIGLINKSLSEVGVIVPARK